MTTTAPPATTPDSPPEPPLAPLALLRNTWRGLTSMRTALVLLFLLALAAVPGSLLPQRPLTSAKVDQYITDHPTWSSILDKAGFFDVFAAPWFAAIYLLLFISLIGCLVPRIRLHWRNVRAQPPATPRRLSRLGEYADGFRDLDDAALLDLADSFALQRCVRRERLTGLLARHTGSAT